MKQPLDYEPQADRDLDEYFEREMRAVKRRMWVTLIVCAIVGTVLVVL